MNEAVQQLIDKAVYEKDATIRQKDATIREQNATILKLQKELEDTRNKNTSDSVSSAD